MSPYLYRKLRSQEEVLEDRGLTIEWLDTPDFVGYHVIRNNMIASAPYPEKEGAVAEAVRLSCAQ